MNDLTKEELEILASILDGSRHAELWGKIQSMIDNYLCKHTWFECFYGEDKIPINLCSKCNLREKR